MREPILITGARAPAALDIARSFSAAGFEVHMADCVPSRMARWSRASMRVHRHPAPRQDAAGFADAIGRLCAALDPLLIIPSCEEVFHLAALAPIHGRLFAPPLATLQRLHSKFMFAEACQSLGLPAPETIRVTSARELDPVREELFLWVVKPEYSRFGTHALVGPDADAVRAIEPSLAAPWVVQRRLHCAEVSFYAASVEASLVAFSAYSSTWRFEAGGAAYAFDPVAPEMFNRLREIADVLARNLIPQGQFACDVIIDDTQTAWLIECNPRATSGAHLFDRSPELALAMLGRRDAPVFGAKPATHVAPALWVYGLPDAFKTRRLREWAHRRRSGSDVIGAPGDRAPVLGALADTMYFGGKALARGRGLTEMMTADIEWNGEPL